MGQMKRLVWLVALAAGAALVHGVVSASSQGNWGGVLYLASAPIPFLTAGIYLRWRHADHQVGPLLIAGTAGTMGMSTAIEWTIAREFPDTGFQPWMSDALLIESLVYPIGIACLSLLIGLFPTGEPDTRWETRFARAVWWLPAASLLANLASEHVIVEEFTYGRFPPFPNALHVEALSWLDPITGQMRNLVGAVLLLSVGVLVARYRRGSAGRRNQIRWVLFGTATALGLGAVPFLIGPLIGVGTPAHTSLIALVGTVALLLIPISMVVAIEQPSWIDADVVIRKTFIYGALSLGIFVVYAALAAGLGLAAGARLPVEIAITVTAVLAFAFQPTRSRLQRIADRWVFGERPTALEAIAGFEDSLEAGNTVDEVATRLAELARSAARLRWTAVTVPPGSTKVSGERKGAPATIVPIERGGERLGTIECGPRIAGGLGQRELELVSALAGQAALLIVNMRLAGRIVGAQEAERRRLERNIHDGAQQELVALVAKLSLARARARNGGIDEETLVELQGDAQAILRDLRELAQGIHPSVLTDGGLVEAVEDRCSRLPIEVAVEASPDLRHQRFGDDIEGAAYFFVTEGLANILKHASASQAQVVIRQSSGELELAVGDNGVGFDPETIRQNGLAGLSDRFTALAGSVGIDARPGDGTVLTARLPVEADRS
jgi:signal transduction histidine kinase